MKYEFSEWSESPDVMKEFVPLILKIDDDIVILIL
jgi:hypothetical protein